MQTPVGGISTEQLSLISRFALNSVGSQGTVGGLLVAGVVSISFIPCFVNQKCF